MIYFPTDWGAKEPQNPQNHRVVDVFLFFRLFLVKDICCMMIAQGFLISAILLAKIFDV